MKQIFSIARKHWLPLLGFNSAVLAATIYAAFYASTSIPPVWTANAKLNLPQTGGLSANLGPLGSTQTTALNFKDVSPLDVQLAILTSDAVMKRVQAVDPEKSLYSKVSSFSQLFVVTPQPATTLIEVEAQGSRPDLAYKRLFTFLEVYQQRLNELRRKDAEVRVQYTQEELEQARLNLNQAQANLSNFQRSTGLVDSPEQSKGLISAINNLKTTQATLIAQGQANATQAQAAAVSLGITPQQAMNSLRLGENKEYQATRTQLSQLESTMAVTRSKYRDDSPQVQSLLQQRQQLLRQLNQQIAVAIPGARPAQIDTTLGNGPNDSRLELMVELIRNQTLAQGAQQQAKQIQKQVDKLNTELNFITKNQAQLLDLQRKYEIAEGVYKGIIAQSEQSKTNPFNAYPNVQTLNEPTIDPRPSIPNLRLITTGGMLAAIFGSMALIFFLENRNPLLKPKDLQQVELPVLGSIPHLKQPSMERNLAAEIDIEFQRLASSILMLEHPCLMVTSATAGEGKTTVTLGLALALVNFGFRVLVIDGDLRKAEMSRRLGKNRIKSAANASPPMPVSVSPGFDLLPALSIPKQKIPEFFARGSFERNIKALRESGGYDYVLVDSPPVGLASETNLMSAVVCNVLFVLRSGTSDRYPVMNSLEQLTRYNARIMGLVVNGSDSHTSVYRYGYGRQRELLEHEA
ncbi:P-loop NTPase [Chroococcidiopsidales cyanobacterium LEGE 13417]|nr:P-loop NTPase [Chroococcidiopsidales cyanobacterium LEGE 13417]